MLIMDTADSSRVYVTGAGYDSDYICANYIDVRLKHFTQIF